MINRHTVPGTLAKKFLKDYEEIMQHYATEEQIELTQHLIKVLELIGKHHETKDDTVYKEWQNQENQLLEKYKSALKPYKAKSFYKYFHFDIVLSEKELYSAEELNNMSPEEQIPSITEVRNFLRICHNGLGRNLERFYLESPSEIKSPANKEPNFEEPTGEVPDKDMTRSRQMLTIYYLLKAGFNIEHRRNSNVSDVAKLIHLMTGTKFNGLNKSEIYKKYKSVPSHKLGAELIKDLKYIRPYFDSMQIQEVVKMIDADIDAALKDIPLGERKKYR